MYVLEINKIGGSKTQTGGWWHSTPLVQSPGDDLVPFLAPSLLPTVQVFTEHSVWMMEANQTGTFLPS
jgi:hypothetical protein